MTINIKISIDRQTQTFLTESFAAIRAISQVYTAQDLQALADLKAGLESTKAKIDLFDLTSPTFQSKGPSR